MAVFYLFFNVGPCFADVLFEIKVPLSFIPSSEGAAVTKGTESPVCLSSGITEDSIPPCKILPLPAFFLIILLKNSFQIAASDSLLFRRRGDDRGQEGDDLRVALMKEKLACLQMGMDDY